MFIGEATCLIGFCFHQRRERQKFRQKLISAISDESNGGETLAEISQQPRMFQWIIAFPTVCDLFGNTLGGIALLYVNASVWQMLGGSMIIFTGVLSKIFFKRKLWPIHWIGMTVSMLGLVLVGLSSVLRDNHQGATKGQVVLGIVLILAAQCFSATQMVVEEFFLKKRKFHPLQVVGVEGFFGIIFMSFLVLPVLYYIPGDQNHHSYENSLDAILMIKNNSQLLGMSVLYICSVSFYSFFGLSVTKSLTAVHTTLIDALRTIVVWVVDLFVHYVFHEGFGEAWDSKYGIFQVDGFLFLLLGNALYNELLIIPPLMPKPEPPQQVQATDEPENDSPGSAENESLLRPCDQPSFRTNQNLTWC
ncbi:solute carrier family 35 member F6-like isoform X2 [Oculina patagonica]